MEATDSEKRTSVVDEMKADDECGCNYANCFGLPSATREERITHINDVMTALEVISTNIPYNEIEAHLVVAQYLYDTTCWNGFEDEHTKAMRIVMELIMKRDRYDRSSRHTNIEVLKHVVVSGLAMTITSAGAMFIAKEGFKYIKGLVQK